MSSISASADSLPLPVASSVSRGKLWAGRVLSWLSILFLGLDAVMKFVQPAPVIEGTAQLGYPASSITGLGVVLLASVILYAIPRTAVLGAILLTGYFGGAIATHVRVENPWLTHILFPVYCGIMVWGGLWLRDPRVRSLFKSNRGKTEAF